VAFTFVIFFVAALSLNDTQTALPLFAVPLFRQLVQGFLLCVVIGTCVDIHEQIQVALSLPGREFHKDRMLDCTLFTVLSLTTGLGLSGAVMVMAGSLQRHGLIVHGGGEFWTYMVASFMLFAVLLERYYRFFLAVSRRVQERLRMTSLAA
jgi:hypothetical protein